MEAPSTTCMIFVRTDAHNLLCTMFNTSFDRAGFYHNGTLWLYWLLPTEEKPYIGLFETFQLKGAKLYISPIDETVLKKFGEIITFLPTDVSISNTMEQINNCAPIGVSIINSLLEQLGSNIKSLNSEKIVLPLKYFDNPTFYYRERSIMAPVCLDLVAIVLRTPPITSTHHITILDRVLETLTLFLDAMDNFSAIDVASITTLRDVRLQVASILGKEIDLPPNGNEGKKNIAGVLVVSQEISDRANAVSKELNNFISSKRGDGPKIIDINNLVLSTNRLFEMLNLNGIQIETSVLNAGYTPYSYMIGIKRPKHLAEKIEPKIELDHGDNGKLYIPLSGEGLEKLSKVDLKEILTVISLVDIEDDRFEYLKSRATSLYYELTS